MSWVDPAGIDHVKWTPVPLALRNDAVAGGAGSIVNDCQPFSSQTVE